MTPERLDVVVAQVARRAEWLWRVKSRRTGVVLASGYAPTAREANEAAAGAVRDHRARAAVGLWLGKPVTEGGDDGRRDH